jgi:hypothetical protein
VRRLALAALVAVAALLASSTEAATPPKATLRVVLKRLPSRYVYIEGAVWHFRLTRTGGLPVTVADLLLLNDDDITLRPRAGTYVLRSADRPCEGNCSMLDPDVAPCTKRVVLKARRKVVATVLATTGRPCRIVLS